jgi:hypothetical protein
MSLFHLAGSSVKDPTFVAARSRAASSASVTARTHKVRRLVLLLSAAVVLGMWATVMGIVLAERDAALERTRVEAHDLAASFEEQLGGVMNTIAGAMDFIQERIVIEGPSFKLRDWTRHMPQLVPSMIQVVLIGPDGWLRDSSLAHKPPPMDLSDREHFRIHVTAPKTGLFIGKPVVGRLSGQVTIQVTRRFELADGSFGGVLLFSLDPEFLTTLHRKIELGRSGVVALVGFDGVVRARFTGAGADQAAPFRVGTLWSDSPALADAASADSGAYEALTPSDRTTRVIEWRRVGNLPLVVVAGLSTDEALASTDRRAMLLFGLAGIVTLVLGALVTVAYLRSRTD